MLIQQIYSDLSALSNYPPEEREEQLEGYTPFLVEIRDIIRVLSRIVGGSTTGEWKIEWGCQPWHLMTCRQQKGLTLQAGWEDELDFGLDLYRDTFEASLRTLTPILSPGVLTPVDLDALEVKDTELDLPTDICHLTHIEHERPLLFHELVSGSSVSSRSIGDNDETLELPVVEEGSEVDSIPDLEDGIDVSNIEIPLWLIPQGVVITLRGRRMVFEREQGPPWQEVLAQMLDEQEAAAADN